MKRSRSVGIFSFWVRPLKLIGHHYLFKHAYVGDYFLSHFCDQIQQQGLDYLLVSPCLLFSFLVLCDLTNSKFWISHLNMVY